MTRSHVSLSLSSPVRQLRRYGTCRLLSRRQAPGVPFNPSFPLEGPPSATHRRFSSTREYVFFDRTSPHPKTRDRSPVTSSRCFVRPFSPFFFLSTQSYLLPRPGLLLSVLGHFADASDSRMRLGNFLNIVGPVFLRTLFSSERDYHPPSFPLDDLPSQSFPAQRPIVSDK